MYPPTPLFPHCEAHFVSFWYEMHYIIKSDLCVCVNVQKCCRMALLPVLHVAMNTGVKLVEILTQKNRVTAIQPLLKEITFSQKFHAVLRLTQTMCLPHACFKFFRLFNSLLRLCLWFSVSIQRKL